MNSILLLSAQTAKIQIGNHASISLDTATTSQGKKSFQINIETDNDSIVDNIEDAIEEIGNETNNIVASSSGEKSCTTTLQDEKEFLSDTLDSAAEIVVPIFTMLFLLVPIVAYFVYSAYKTNQERKWKESLLNKGISLEEIEKQYTVKDLEENSPKNDMINYEKRKYLKYAMVFTALGVATIFGYLLSSFWVFVGIIFIALGVGSWHFHNQLK